MRFKNFAYAAAIAASLAAATSASAVTISVTPWVSPNAFGSPSYATAIQNQFNALLNNTSSAGDPNSPTYYQAQSNITRGQIIVTNFPSWNGSANPVADYGSAYANELGNRPLFGLEIDGQGTQFAIADLAFVATSNDAGNSLGFSRAVGSYNYGDGYVGIQFGANGALGGGDDIYITSGPNTQIVDYLIGRGSGSAFSVTCDTSTECTTIASRQALIDLQRADPTFPTQFTGTYSLPAVRNVTGGSGTFNISDAVTAVPEPSTWASMILGLGLVGWLARRRKTAAFAAA